MRSVARALLALCVWWRSVKPLRGGGSAGGTSCGPQATRQGTEGRVLRRRGATRGNLPGKVCIWVELKPAGGERSVVPGAEVTGAMELVLGHVFSQPYHRIIQSALTPHRPLLRRRAAPAQQRWCVLRQVARQREKGRRQPRRGVSRAGAAARGQLFVRIEKVVVVFARGVPPAHKRRIRRASEHTCSGAGQRGAGGWFRDPMWENCVRSAPSVAYCASSICAPHRISGPCGSCFGGGAGQSGLLPGI